MRHLRVPSTQTSHWIDLCKTNGWYETGYRVQRVDDNTAIPLNTNAPQADDSVWGENTIIELDVTHKKNRHYWEHISNEIRTEFRDESLKRLRYKGCFAR